jgi:hypothetical protein
VECERKMIVCDSCGIKTRFGYARIELGKRVILCYECAKELDRYEQR